MQATYFSFTLILSLVLYSCIDSQEEEGNQRIRIGVAASLGPTIRGFADSIERSVKGISLEVSAAGSNVLVSQSLSGAPFDIVLLASSSLMDRLENADALLADSRRVIGNNRLCVVVPRSSDPPRSLADLASERFGRVGIGSPGVPAGDYARQALSGVGLLDRLEDRFIFGTNVRQVLAWVEHGEVDCGFVYVSDTAGAENLQIGLLVDQSLHDPIRYEGGVLKGTRQSELALQILKEIEIGE